MVVAADSRSAQRNKACPSSLGLWEGQMSGSSFSGEGVWFSIVGLVWRVQEAFTMLGYGAEAGRPADSLRCRLGTMPATPTTSAHSVITKRKMPPLLKAK